MSRRTVVESYLQFGEDVSLGECSLLLSSSNITAGKVLRGFSVEWEWLDSGSSAKSADGTGKDRYDTAPR